MTDDILKTEYGLAVSGVERAALGAGSDTFFVRSDIGRLVVKFPAVSGMNNPAAEPALCEYLRARGVPACEFIKNRRGEYLSRDGAGRLFHVQRFVEGRVWDENTAPDWLLGRGAELLGRIHTVLRGYEGLPVGIGEGFFRQMTPESAIKSHVSSLERARELGDGEAERDISFRLALLRRMGPPRFDLRRLTCLPSHGDYMPAQLICGESGIRAVIDWTTACVHPVIWEIARFYVYASPRCAGGAVDFEDFRRYLGAYLARAPLNEYDLAQLWPLFFYQSAVADYYGQYFASTAANRRIYRRQAALTTGVLRALEGRMADESLK